MKEIALNDAVTLAWAFACGAGLGWLYFYGLWQTVRRLPVLRSPHLWLLTSLVLRQALLLVGLYWIGHGDWRRFVAALAGILLLRLVLTRRIGVLQATALAQPFGRSKK